MKNATYQYLKVMLIVVGISMVGSFTHAQTLGSLHLSAGSDQGNEQVLVEEGMSLKQALERVEQQFNVVFLYRTDALTDKKISGTKMLSNNVKKALEELLEEQGLVFTYLNPKTYGIYEPEEISKKKEPVIQQVSGQVTDAQSGETLPGVNILVKGTTTGTSTDTDGNFELEVPSLQDTLVVSFVGYQSQEVSIGGRTEVDIALQPQAIAGEELVVVGYGTQRRGNITGSITSVDTDQINSQNVTPVSIDRLLQGRVAGVQITQASTEPGGSARIRIRGSTSVTAGNTPLYVIDGVPIDNSNVTPGPGAAGISGSNQRNPLNSLNPNDIEDIQILKDASATAIYGSRGANGVILITTKHGVQGDLDVSYDTYIGFQQVDRTLKMLSAPDYMSVLNELRVAQGEDPEFSSDQISEVGNGTNWQDEIFQDNAPLQNHHLSFSGGVSGTRYYTSLSYFDQEGLVQNSGIKRYQGRINLSRDETERFSYGINLNVSLVEDDFTAKGTGTNEFAGVINSAINQDPTFPVRNSEGEFTDISSSNLENPVAMLNLYDHAESNRMQGNVYAQYDLTDNLTTKINFGSDQRTVRRDTYNPSFTRRGAAAQGIANVGINNSSNYVVETTANYVDTFFDSHEINFLGGFTYQVFSNDGLSGVSRGFATDAFKTNNLQAGDVDENNASTSRNKNQLLSYLGRINYVFKRKYMLTTSFRIDGSSRFGLGNKYGYFPSLALGWNIGQEEFISSLGIFSDLKIRGSYGITGNQEIGNYNSLPLYSLSGSAILNETQHTAVAPEQIPNPDLKWETTEQINFGLDIEFQEGRFRGAVDYFQQNTRDLLLNLPIPITSGFGSSLQNVGSVKNSGFEFEVISNNILSTTDFNWTTTLNFSHIRNEVTDIGDLPEIIQGGIGFARQFSIIRVGQAMNSYYGFIVDGVFQLDDDITNSVQPGAQPGELKYRDVSGDGQITSDDRTILGTPFPDYTFGIANSFSFKDFKLNISIYGSYGNDILNLNIIEAENPIDFRRNRLAEPLLNRWTPENPTNDHPSFIPPSVAYGGNVTSRAVQDASFIRLQNLMFRYQIPASFLKSASIYIAGTNLITITGYDGYNPDVSSLGGGNIVVDNNAYPLARTYTLGFNVNF